MGYCQADNLGLWYKLGNFGVEKSPGSPNLNPRPSGCEALSLSRALSLPLSLSLSLSASLSLLCLSLVLSRCLSLSLSHTHTVHPALSISLSLSRARSLSLSSNLNPSPSGCEARRAVRGTPGGRSGAGPRHYEPLLEKRGASNVCVWGRWMHVNAT